VDKGSLLGLRGRLGIISIIILLAIWTIAPCFMEGEDEVEGKVPWLFVLGGGVAGERLVTACQLFLQGQGHQGVVLTGGNVETYVTDRAEFVQRCGIPKDSVREWPAIANSFQEMSTIGKFLAAEPSARAIVVSDALHMPRLRYLRGRLSLNNKIFFRQSRLSHNLDLTYIFHVVVFWYREPLAYVFYRFRY
jgi:uncharacterized SAM-binding protein YcdF (DUF218 family)